MRQRAVPGKAVGECSDKLGWHPRAGSLSALAAAAPGETGHPLILAKNICTAPKGDLMEDDKVDGLPARDMLIRAQPKAEATSRS